MEFERQETTYNSTQLQTKNHSFSKGFTHAFKAAFATKYFKTKESYNDKLISK